MDIKEILRKRGANDQQLNSKTVKMIEEAIAEMSSEELGGVSAEEAVKIKNEMNEMASKIARDIFNYHSLTLVLDSGQRRANDAREALDNSLKAYESIAKFIPTTGDVLIAVAAYSGILEATKKILGEDLSDEVLKSAIEAASYGAWRSVMGESKPLVEKMS